MKKSDAIAELVEKALVYNRGLEQAARLESKGGDARKLNPYATDMGRCERQVGYSLMNYPESDPPDMQSLANFLFGHAAEDAYAKILGQLPEPEDMVVLREVRLQIGNTSGRADFLIWDPHLRTLVEMKTTKGWQVKWLPNKDHEKQLMFYMHAGKLGMLEQYGITAEDCDSAVLLYIRKDATRGMRTYLTFDVLYDERTVLLALEKNEELLELALAGILPARPKGMTPDKFPCGDKKGKAWCPYFTTCWRG